MNIKTRLSVQFTFLVFVILLTFSLLVYYFSYTSQLSKFRENLLDRAKNTAILLINVQEVDSTLLKRIHQTTISLEQEEIALTDSSNKLLYSNQMRYLSEDKLTYYLTGTSPIYFSIGEKDGVIYNHRVNDQIYHVYVLACDKYRTENLRGLWSVLLWSVIFSLWLSVTISYFFSKMAIKPISKIIAKMKEINSSKLSDRLDEGNKQDEIEQLAITFNQMLSDLERVFKSQDEFVSNASHELRTPLAVMIAESDYIMGRDRNPEEYIEHIRKQTNDLKQLNILLNSLLELAHLHRDNKVTLTEVRIDELVLNAIQAVKAKYPGRKLIPKVDYSENENEMMVLCNPGLLEIAFKNLLDNACKFSTDDIEVIVSVIKEITTVTITDFGIGIPEHDIAHIFKPFNRGSNAKFIGGFGVGLSIVSKIIELHEAEMEVLSTEGKNTTVKLIFRNLLGKQDPIF